MGNNDPIRRELYGGNAAGRDFCNNLCTRIKCFDFVSCTVDPDVWTSPAQKSDGSNYYEYVLLYTNDVLVISDN